MEIERGGKGEEAERGEWEIKRLFDGE